MKKYNIQFFDTSGAFLKTLGSDKINNQKNIRKNNINFGQKLNGGQEELRLELALPFSTLPEYLSLGNFIKVYELNKENPLGKIIYQGFISSRERAIQESSEAVNITCLGLHYLLFRDFYMDGSSFLVSWTSAEIKDILINILDNFQAVYGSGFITYDVADIEPVGTLVNVDFDTRKWGQAINDCLSISGSGFYWFVGADGKFQFKQLPTTATHTFTNKKNLHIATSDINIEQVINNIILIYDNAGVATEKQGIAPLSVAKYGAITEYIENLNIKSTETADLFLENRLSNFSEPVANNKLMINSLFNIELINPGNTCRIANIPKNQTAFSENMIINHTQYNEDRVDIGIGTRYKEFSFNIKNLK